MIVRHLHSRVRVRQRGLPHRSGVPQQLLIPQRPAGRSRACGSELMPCVLWGIGCLSLPGPTTAAEVAREFREALSVPLTARGPGSEKLSAGKSQPRVDLYRLVRIEDQAGCRLDGDEHVVAHLPESSWGCWNIEDMCRQRDDAEMRYDRARESLVSLMENMEYGEVLDSPLRSADARVVPDAQGSPTTPHSQQLWNVLRQENKVLRYKLSQSEVVREELQETAEMLRREFMLLVEEIMPRGSQAVAGSPALAVRHPGLARAVPMGGNASTSSGAGPLISASDAGPVVSASGAGPLISATPALRADGGWQRGDAWEAGFPGNGARGLGDPASAPVPTRIRGIQGMTSLSLGGSAEPRPLVPGLALPS